MTSPTVRLAAVIPCLDAQDTIAEVVRATCRHIDRVIVVDDGSSDLSARYAAAAGAELLRHDTTHGKGAALRSGFSLPLGRPPEIPEPPEGAPPPDAVVTLDADGQHDSDDIPAQGTSHFRTLPDTFRIIGVVLRGWLRGGPRAEA